MKNHTKEKSDGVEEEVRDWLKYAPKRKGGPKYKVIHKYIISVFLLITTSRIPHRWGNLELVWIARMFTISREVRVDIP